MNLLAWTDPKSITNKTELEKILKYSTRFLYFFTLASAAVKSFVMPKDYYKIFYDFATYNTESWGKGFDIGLWSSVFSGFLLVIIFRLYLQYKNIALTTIDSKSFYLWLFGMSLITIDGILFIPIIKGTLFWIIYSLFHLNFGTVKEFLTTLNAPLFAWFDYILIFIFSLYAEKVLPKKI